MTLQLVPTRARVVDATVRDLTYVASRMRPEDREEIDCQHPGWAPAELAYGCLPGWAYVVELDGNPEMAFGVVPRRQGLWEAWSWGTGKSWRAAPAAARFVRDRLVPAMLSTTATRIEARSLATHGQAARFLRQLGARERCRLPGFGVHGEEFILWDWTRGDHVLQDRHSEAARAA